MHQEVAKYGREHHLVRHYEHGVRSCSDRFFSESLEGAAQLIVSLNHNGEDELVIQTRSFIETILSIFSTHGVFNTLCKVGPPCFSSGPSTLRILPL